MSEASEPCGKRAATETNLRSVRRSYKEFIEFVYASNSSSAAIIKVRKSITGGMDADCDCGKIFKKYDSKGSNFVKLADFKSAVGKISGGEVKKGEVEDLIKR